MPVIVAAQATIVRTCALASAEIETNMIAISKNVTPISSPTGGVDQVYYGADIANFLPSQERLDY
jgi:hypothetical protein